ncbi:hypothetical protein T4D_318 [Trichinella pseudospiralis]|uniref:Uncharacterized protein n=1 Tax=Trichinella pseudospiralis TaxID=6337 RepID=A0A0V1FVP1_TRIPS|nr:hypothetical protein T4D_318 [Trichinella pseudospiralis]
MGGTVTEISAKPDMLRAGLQAARAKRPISCKLGCQVPLTELPQ